MREDFKATIVESSRDFTAKERIQLKDTTAAIKLADATKEGGVVIAVDAYAVIEVHNEHSENTDYTIYVLIDKGGSTYYTSSKPLFDSFKDMWDEMKDETEDWEIEVYRVPSKNQSGDFLTCKIL